MKKMVVALMLLTALQVQAQKAFKKHSVYAEVLGNGIILSANYELQLGDKPGFGIRAGLGLAGGFEWTYCLFFAKGERIGL